MLSTSDHAHVVLALSVASVRRPSRVLEIRVQRNLGDDPGGGDRASRLLQVDNPQRGWVDVQRGATDAG